MDSYHNEQFLSSAQKGSIEEIKKAIVQGNVDINYQDKDGYTALFYGIQAGHLDVVRFLIQNDASLEVYDTQGSGALHKAAEKINKEMVLLLVISGADPNYKNNSQQKPGDGHTEIKTFINNLYAEQRAFTALKPQQKQKLASIFDDIDYDSARYIDFHKAVKFNKYIEDTVTDQTADKDARDFLKCTAICNSERVNIDEWMFSFSKLFVVDPAAYEKFIEDYDKQVEKKQKLRLQQD